MWDWFSGTNKANIEDPTSFQVQRSIQIEQLKIFNQNVVEVHRDLEYRVATSINGKQLFLYITLPPGFPQDKPEVKLTPRIRHQWVNDLMIVVGSPSLNNFSVHSDLGASIKEVIDEFQRNPPAFEELNSHGMERFNPYPNLTSTPPRNMSSGYSGYTHTFSPPYPVQPQMPTLPPSSHSYDNRAVTAGGVSMYQPPSGINQPYSVEGASHSESAKQPVNHIPKYPQPFAPAQSASVGPSAYRMPEIPAFFPQLKDLSNEELEALMESEEKLIEALQRTPQLVELQQSREAICECNELISRENLSKKPVIEDKKRIILEKYDQLNELRSRFDDCSRQQEELRKRYSPQLLKDRLRIAAVQAEEEAESLADQFVEGKITLDQFRKDYMEVRTLSHLRKVKEEKLNSVLVRVPYS